MQEIIFDMIMASGASVVMFVVIGAISA